MYACVYVRIISGMNAEWRVGVHALLYYAQRSRRIRECRYDLLYMLFSGKLPEYAPTADFLSPHHCRLCLQPYEPGELGKHLKVCPKSSAEDGAGGAPGVSFRPPLSSSSQDTLQKFSVTANYRREVLGKTLTEWPQQISPQVLRTRLAAFKDEMCDANFQQLPCASCCRLKRRCKLTKVCFPPPTAPQPPAWLPLSQDEWLLYREEWLKAIDHIPFFLARGY